MKLQTSLILGLLTGLTLAQSYKNAFNQLPSCLVPCIESLVAETCASDTDLLCFCQNVGSLNPTKAIKTPQCLQSIHTCTTTQVNSGFNTLTTICTSLISGGPPPMPSGGGSGGGSGGSGSGGGGSGGGSPTSMPFNPPTITPPISTPTPTAGNSGAPASWRHVGAETAAAAGLSMLWLLLIG